MRVLNQASYVPSRRCYCSFPSFHSLSSLHVWDNIHSTFDRFATTRWSRTTCADFFRGSFDPMVQSRRWHSDGKEGMAIPSAPRRGSRRMAHTDESIFHEPLTFVRPSTLAPSEAACTSTSCTFQYLGWWSIRHHTWTECDDALSIGWSFGWTIHLVRFLFGSHPEGFPHGSDPTNRRKRRRNRGVE